MIHFLGNRWLFTEIYYHDDDDHPDHGHLGVLLLDPWMKGTASDPRILSTLGPSSGHGPLGRIPSFQMSVRELHYLR